MNKIYIYVFSIVFSISILSLNTNPVYSAETSCPKGYICLKVDDPLILASTTCLNLNQKETPSVMSISKNPSFKSLDNNIKFTLDSKDKDFAGIWDVFDKGMDSQGLKSDDWGFLVEIYLDKPKVVKSITIINNQGNEGWSTSEDERLFGKKPYPLVVFDENNRQLNSKYEDIINLNKGKNTLSLYGQIEVYQLIDTEIVFIFTDNTYIRAALKDSASIQDNKKLHANNENSLWFKLKSLFGF